MNQAPMIVGRQPLVIGDDLGPPHHRATMSSPPDRRPQATRVPCSKNSSMSFASPICATSCSSPWPCSASTASDFISPSPASMRPHIREQLSKGGQSEFRLRHALQLPLGLLRRRSCPGHHLRPGHHALHLRLASSSSFWARSCPRWRRLKKEGEPGIRKINEWTRYITVGVCVVQAFIYGHFNSSPRQQQPLLRCAQWRATTTSSSWSSASSC